MDRDLRRRDSFKVKLKLYLVRISPCCRIVWLYCLCNDLPIELVDVDVFAGEHRTTDFLKMNPNGEVPVLVDGKVVVYDAVPILLYLSEKYTKLFLFGETEKDTLLVKSLLNWASTQLHTTVGYRLVYPHFMEAYQPGEDATESLIEKGTVELTTLLEMIENNLLGDRKYIAGDVPTIADYYVASVLIQLEWISFEFNMWRKIDTWMASMKQMNHWELVHEKHYGFVNKLRSESQESL